MARAMSKQETREVWQGFIQFPERLNAFAIFLIVVLYGAILYLISSLSFPPADYHVGLKNLNYVTGAESANAEINPFVLIKGIAIDENDDEKKVELGVQYKVYSYIDAFGSYRPTRINYFYSVADKEGKTWYIYETTRSVTTSSYRIVTHNLVGNNLEIGKDAITEVYMKVRYDDNDEKNKQVKVAENIIELKKKELKSSIFTSNNTLEDILQLTFTLKNLDSEKLNFNFKIDLLPLNPEPFHLNMQTWIVTDGGKIFPLNGLYNYKTTRDFSPSIETEIYKYVQAKYIYAKLAYTDNEQNTRWLYYKVAVADLLEA